MVVVMVVMVVVMVVMVVVMVVMAVVVVVMVVVMVVIDGGGDGSDGGGDGSDGMLYCNCCSLVNLQLLYIHQSFVIFQRLHGCTLQSRHEPIIHQIPPIILFNYLSKLHLLFSNAHPIIQLQCLP